MHRRTTSHSTRAKAAAAAAQQPAGKRVRRRKRAWVGARPTRTQVLVRSVCGGTHLRQLVRGCAAVVPQMGVVEPLSGHRKLGLQQVVVVHAAHEMRVARRHAGKYAPRVRLVAVGGGWDVQGPQVAAANGHTHTFTHSLTRIHTLARSDTFTHIHGLTHILAHRLTHLLARNTSTRTHMCARMLMRRVPATPVGVHRHLQPPRAPINTQAQTHALG